MNDGFCPECYGIVSGCRATGSGRFLPAMPPLPTVATAAAAACRRLPLPRLPAAACLSVRLSTLSLAQGRGKLEKRDVAGFRGIIVRAFECEDCGFKCAPARVVRSACRRPCCFLPAVT